MDRTSHGDAPLALAITGASGARYWLRFLDVVLGQGVDVHLVHSAPADGVCRLELGRSMDELLEEMTQASPGEQPRGRLLRFDPTDFHAPLASGSARYRGMAVVPCTSGTLGRIASGTSDNLIVRAADVMLKEGRPLILLLRETPLNLIQLENMTRLARAGAVIMPASPGFYQDPQSVDELVDFMVQRICDRLEIPCALHRRWGDDRSGDGASSRD